LCCLGLGSVGDSDIHADNDGDDNDEHNDNPEADPLLLSCAPSALDALIKFRVGLDYVLLDLLSLLLNVGDERLLLHDNIVEILEELGEFNDGLLDALNLVVALSHSIEGSLRLAAAVRVEKSLLKDLCVWVLNCLPNLFIASIRPHNSILPSLLLLHLFPEIAFNTLVVVDGLL